MKNEGTTGEQLNSFPFLFIVLGVFDASRNSLKLRTSHSFDPHRPHPSETRVEATPDTTRRPTIHERYINCRILQQNHGCVATGADPQHFLKLL
jgi:hypothetical protein